MKSTIKDVADRSGVSIATVSRVINGASVVSEKSRKKVLEAIKELDFKPNQVARNLVMQKNTTIGIIVPGMGNQYYGGILNGIEEESSKLGYDVMLCTSGGESQNEIRHLEMFEERHVAGIIVMAQRLKPETVQKINDLKTPVIMMNRSTSGLKCPTVSIDNFRAAYEITNYLIEKGHRKIALFRNSMDIDACGVEQYSGFERALAEHGLSIDRSLVKYGEFRTEKSYELMAELIRKKNVPTAVIATSDIMAVGACNALVDNGYKVPEDVSVVGFNDIQLAGLYRPSLTVIHQPLKAMGAEAVRMIVNVNKNEDESTIPNDGRTVILSHSLIERQSSAEVKK
ncbi:MAG: LacI family DNA-binding transcriptional regulator [Firmicutes bacterium]|nr:LacI family transcriptional regulator [Clostridiales bacterium]MBQ4340098.1 LacI family DNA-binding transcriptional regulator [Bacillota bacterium]